MLECVVNVSEGRDERLLAQLAASCGEVLLDVHRDPVHHRSVLTLAGPDDVVERAARALTSTAVALLDLGGHHGVHPRLGVVDVVPFVALSPGSSGSGDVDASGVVPDLAVDARDRFAEWAGTELALPCFRYGPMPDGTERTLPEVRRQAFAGLHPDTGPDRPHPTAGAAAVGARPVMVAYNLWVTGIDVAAAREIARIIRRPSVRALAFDLGGAVQVSCNLLSPAVFGPAQVFDEVAALLPRTSAGMPRAELVGLVPEVVLATTPRRRWAALAIGPEVTIEARLADPSLRTR